MPAVQILDVSVRPDFEKNHGCIFAYAPFAKELIDHGGKVREFLTREELSVDDALQSGGDDGRGDAFAGYISDHGANAVVDGDGIEKVSADGATREGPGLQGGEGDRRKLDGHEACVNASGDHEFFSGEAGFQLGLRQ